jgi:hypothetical protein
MGVDLQLSSPEMNDNKLAQSDLKVQTTSSSSALESAPKSALESMPNVSLDASSDLNAGPPELNAELISAAVENMLSSVFPIFVEVPNGAKAEILVSQGDGLTELRKYISHHPLCMFMTSYSLELNGQTLLDYGFSDSNAFVDPNAPKEENDSSEQHADNTNAKLEVSKISETDGKAESQDMKLAELVASIPHIEPNCTLKVVPLPYSKYTARDHLDHFQSVMYKWQGSPEIPFSSQLSTIEESDIAHAEQNPFDPKHYEIDSIVSDPSTLFVSSSTHTPFVPSLQSLTYSGWHPPLPNRELLGDLSYLEIVTIENKTLTITSSVNGFYVNQSTSKKFNPIPDSRWRLCHTLVDLLKLVSVGFANSLNRHMGSLRTQHPFELVVAPLPPHNWVEKVEEPVCRFVVTFYLFLIFFSLTLQ